MGSRKTLQVTGNLLVFRRIVSRREPPQKPVKRRAGHGQLAHLRHLIFGHVVAWRTRTKPASPLGAHPCVISSWVRQSRLTHHEPPYWLSTYRFRTQLAPLAAARRSVMIFNIVRKQRSVRDYCTL